jgi:hypothetical protein
VRLVGGDGAGFGRAALDTRPVMLLPPGAVLRCAPLARQPACLHARPRHLCPLNLSPVWVLSSPLPPILPQAVRAEQDGADYLGAGAVFPTGTKETGGWVGGWEGGWLRSAVHALRQAAVCLAWLGGWVFVVCCAWLWHAVGAPAVECACCGCACCLLCMLRFAVCHRALRRSMLSMLSL